MPEYAFVQGVGRSGTTAMAQLLNAHPNVCIGIERYKYLVQRQKHVSMDLFDKDRFFRFDPGDTNVLAELPRWAPVYKAMSEKWESAHVIGDKLSARLLRYIARDVPNSRHIYMVRGIDRVASSWNLLALQQKGAWTSNDDYRVAVSRWNEANAIALRHMDTLGPRMLIVEYERFFSGVHEMVARLSEFLGVSLHPHFVAAYENATHHYREHVAVKPATVLDGQRELIDRKADLSAYRQLVKASRDQFATNTVTD